jgi:hypothetical protein
MSDDRLRDHPNKLSYCFTHSTSVCVSRYDMVVFACVSLCVTICVDAGTIELSPTCVDLGASEDESRR